MRWAMARSMLSAVALLTVMVLFSPSPVAHGFHVTGELTAQVAVETHSPHATSWNNHLQLRLDESWGPVDVLAAVDMVHSGGGPTGTDVSVEMSEVALIWHGDRFRLQFGRSLLNWGTAMKLSPTNVVNPVVPFDAEFRRLPVQLVALTHYPADDWEWTAVWIPEFRPSIGAVPHLPQIHVQYPGSRLEHTQGGGRLLYRGPGLDVSIVGFSGWESAPYVINTSQGPVARYRRMTTMGAGVASAVGDVGVWAEGRHSVFDDEDKQSEVVIGADYSLSNGVYLLGQIRYLNDDGHTSYAFMAAVEGTWASIHSWSVGVMADPEARSAVVRPLVDVSLADGLALRVGGAFTVGDAPVIGAPQVGSRVHAALRANF